MSTKLAVAFIDPMSYNNLAVYDYGIINGIEKNIQLTFFCNSKYNYKPIYNTKIHSIFNYSDKKLLFKIKSYIISIIRALIIIKKEKIAIIHILWFRLPFFDVFVWSLVKFLNPNIKIVHTAHNILPHKKKPADTLFYALIYKITDKIICHTDNSRKELIAKFHLPSAKVTTIPHGILEFELDDSTLSKKIASLRQKYSLNKKIIISALGSQHFYKGTDLLIDTWKENFAKDNDKILIIAGKNIGIKIDINGLPENIIYINDFLTQEEFNAILRMSHLIVLPYRKISQSGVLLTAISEQIPFLVSNVGGLAEPLKHGDVGWEFNINISNDLNNKLKIALNSKTELLNIKSNENLWQGIKKEYSWPRIQNQIIDLYKELSLT